MKQLNPYLHFDGKCKEAMTFYKDCLRGELVMQSIGESPLAANMQPEAKDNILHAALTVDGKMVLMASDMFEGAPIVGNTMTVCVVCDSKDEITSLFSKLSDGGKVIHPLEEAFFGTIGNVTDKFGVQWMLEFDAPKHS